MHRLRPVRRNLKIELQTTETVQSPVKRVFIFLSLTASASAGEIDAFLDQHCIECHDDVTAKGGLDLYSLSSEEMGSSIHEWTSIYDRVAAGEMPPEKKPRPETGDIATFLAAVAPPLATADLLYRETVQRRLNRVEYENTIRDLLGVGVDLQSLLPEDQIAHGFDNIGAALALSPELMERYLAAARKALDAVFVEGERPETVTFTADAFRETEPYLGKQFAKIDGRIVEYLTAKEQYSKISTRSQRTPTAGLYRFKFTAATHRSEKPLVFRVNASDFAPSTALYQELGYFEAGPEPKEFVIEAEVEKKSAIQFFSLGLKTWGKDPAQNPEFPGIGFSPVEITGPLYDEWPPESHRALSGEPETVLREFLPKAFRRPVEEVEVARYLDLAETRSLRVALTAALCSPNFLYQREVGTELDQNELSSRLSYFLWSSMPEGTRSVEEMLTDSRADAFVENFTGQWLQLRDINETSPDTKLYPGYDEVLQESMLRESRSFFRHVLENDLPIRNFLHSDFAMLNARLAEHYELPPVEGFALRPVTLPVDSKRGGVLTQGAVLKVTANGTNTSPILRGVWVLENILGTPTPPPPPNIAGIEPDIRGATTIREQLDLHRDSESCQSCHVKIDPPGFALEMFDPVGRYREKYARWIVSNAEKGWGSLGEGAEVDPTGEFADFREALMDREEDFAHCFTEKLFTYALGREMGFSDRPTIEKLARPDVGLRTLIREIVASDLFDRP